MDVLQAVLAKYNIDKNDAEIIPFGTGLINHTWKVICNEEHFILQRINTAVFKDPYTIDHNIGLIARYLSGHQPDYLFVSPIPSADGESLVHITQADGGFYRLYPFINGSHSRDVVTDAEQAFAAAAQFGRLTRLLSGFDVNELKTTLPSFHDLSLRYVQFKEALLHGDRDRIAASEQWIAKAEEHSGIVDTYRSILQNTSFKKRVTHHDTKISNVLFDEENEALCVIDLDTLMPGYFISDVGDMMRTYLPTVSEEEKDFSRIAVRDDVYRAIVVGYFAEMEDELTQEEIPYFFYAGTFMIYMQALRFLTDHLNRDEYYGASYEGHNLVRAGNQFTLLERLLEKAAVLNMM